MDWTSMAIAWGPAVPILFVLLKAHHDVIYKVFPLAIREIRAEIKESAKESAKRHEEHVGWQRKHYALLQRVVAKRMKRSRPAKRRAKKK